MKNLLILLLCSLSLTLVAQKPDPGSFKTKVGDQVPAFSFETYDGVTMTNKDLEGKIVLLNFWATWCGPCVKEMPGLNDFVATQSSDDFVVIALARQQDNATIKPFIDKNGYDFTFVADVDKKVYANFAEKSIPRNVVLDADGKIIFQLLGYYPEEIKKMEKLIAKKVEELNRS